MHDFGEMLDGTVQPEDQYLNASIATSYEQYLEETANEICDQTTSYFSGIEATFLSKIDLLKSSAL